MVGGRKPMIQRQFFSAAGLAAALILLANPAAAKGKSTIEKSGKIVAIALPVVAAGISAAKSDWNGVAQVTLVTTLTLGTAYGLKHFIHEKRPDGSDDKSFPSDTAALAFAPATYLWHRYGWEYGVPAYAAAAYVGYSRVDAKKHHWYDVAASAGIALGYDLLITRRYHKPQNFYTGVYATPHSAYVSMNYTW